MVECEECGEEVGKDFYYGFMLLGVEYEFEHKKRCDSCTEKVKWKYWNETVMDLDLSNPCEVCPFESIMSCVVYWDATEVEKFGKMEDHNCFKRKCALFLEANK